MSSHSKKHQLPIDRASPTLSGIYMLKWKMMCKSAVPTVNWNTSAIVVLVRPVSALYFDLQTRGRHVNRWYEVALTQRRCSSVWSQEMQSSQVAEEQSNRSEPNSSLLIAQRVWQGQEQRLPEHIWAQLLYPLSGPRATRSKTLQLCWSKLATKQT